MSMHPLVSSGRVTKLVMKAKDDCKFKYRPGQYIYVNCPELARFDWHPFTVSSAPGDPYITVHIHAAGHWTNSLYELAEQKFEALEKVS
jgi:predicted ferric reductase